MGLSPVYMTRWVGYNDIYIHIYLFQVIQGNANQYASDLRRIEPAIIARIIRFIPTSSLPKFVCMRVEVYGCTWEGK